MVDMKFEGLDELIKISESLSTSEELEEINKKILKDCSNLAYDTVKPKVHKSKDNSKSGRKGSRPSGHAADNIPKAKFKKKNGNLYVLIGWEKTDNSPYYYMKMEEWGTTKRPPHHSFGTVNKLLKDKYNTIATFHYESLVKKLESR